MAFGPFISRNLTPNAAGLPAGLTFEQFLHVLRTGEDLDFLPPHVPSDTNYLLQVNAVASVREKNRQGHSRYLRIPEIDSAFGGIPGRFRLWRDTRNEHVNVQRAARRFFFLAFHGFAAHLIQAVSAILSAIWMQRQFTLEFRVAAYSRSEQHFELLSRPILDETFSIIRNEDLSRSRMCLKDEVISDWWRSPSINWLLL
jgi:hypothetical protein